jgi:PKD repeat protein
MPHPPVAKFTAVVTHFDVAVDASASSDSDGTIQSYTWNWGDESALEVLTVSTASHTYLVEKAYTITLTVTDNDGLTGDATADVVARMPHPPVAKFTAVVTHFDVAVDASASSDADGTIQSYTWNWGDESALEVLTVSTASHTYLDKGTYTITLTVKDNDGLSESAQEVVNIIDNFPQASFTSSATGLTVTVNAGGSSDDYGIVSYTWDWGDGSAPEVLTTSTASHTYTAPASVLAVVTSQHVVVASGTAPGPPYPVAGYTRDSAGAILPSCTVTITDVNTGEYTTVLSGTNGFYSVNLGGFAAWTAGDIVKVTAVKGTLAGENQGTVAGTYLALDVKLIETGSPPFDVVITLTVTDTIGQTTTVQETVTIYP